MRDRANVRRLGTTVRRWAADRGSIYGSYAVLGLYGCAPIAWLRDGRPIKDVDSYFSLHPQGLALRSLYLWDGGTSTGQPTSDAVSWAITNWQAALATAGLRLATIEALTMTILSLSALIGMYRLVAFVLGDTLTASPRSWVSAAAALAWLTNPFSLSFVWFHQLLTEFTWAALPWLVHLLLTSIPLRRNLDFGFRVTAVPIVLILGSAGFVHAYLPGLALLLTILGVGTVIAAANRHRALRNLAIFAAVTAVGLGWWVLPSLPIIPALLSSASIGPSSRAQFLVASTYSDLQNVLSLTAVPALHQTVNGVPYMSWSSLVIDWPGKVLIFVLPLTALLGLVSGCVNVRTRWISISAGIAVLIGSLLSKGLNWPFPEMNYFLTQLPYGDVFRHPVDKFSFLLILPLCLLFALGLAQLVQIRLAIYAVAIAGTVCVYIALPWWTGAVIPSGGGLLPSAHVEMPSSYNVVGADLAASSPGGKTMVLPYSVTAESAFQWKSGVQPNQDCLFRDWAPNRGVICHPTGQRYPDLVSNSLAEAVRRGDPRAFALARMVGVDRWIIHKDWALAYRPTEPSPSDAQEFLLNPYNYVPAPLLPRDGRLVPIPSQTSFALYFLAHAAPATEDRLLSLGPIVVQINRAATTIPEVFMGIYDTSHRLWNPSMPISIGRWHEATISIVNGRISFAIDGIRQNALYSCPVDAPCDPSDSGPTLDAPVYQASVLKPSAAPSITDIAGLVPASLVMDHPVTGSPVSSVRSTPELSLYSQDALPLIYAAQSLVDTGPLVNTDDMLSAADESAHQPYPAVVPYDLGVAIDPYAHTVWSEDDPTRYHGEVDVEGTTVLVFLQSLDSRWNLTVNGQQRPLTTHVLVNGFANAWIIRGHGRVSWTLDYEPQRAADIGNAFGAMLMCASLISVGVWTRIRTRLPEQGPL